MLWIPNLLRQLVISNVSVRCMYSLLTLQLWIFLALLSLGCNGRWSLLHFSSPLTAERLGVGHETEILKCCGLINVTTLSSLGSILLFRIVCQTGEELRWWCRALRGHLVWNKLIRGTLFFFFFCLPPVSVWELVDPDDCQASSSPDENNHVIWHQHKLKCVSEWKRRGRRKAVTLWRRWVVIFLSRCSAFGFTRRIH